MQKTNSQAPRPPSPKGGLEATGDNLAVRGRLALLGWPSLAAWADAMGYDPQMVRITIKQWGNRTDREPHGGIGRALMRDLRRTLAEEVRAEAAHLSFPHIKPSQAA